MPGWRLEPDVGRDREKEGGKRPDPKYNFQEPQCAATFIPVETLQRKHIVHKVEEGALSLVLSALLATNSFHSWFF